MRTIVTLTVILVAAFVTRSVYAEDAVSKGDHYYQLYAETLESARQAADKGYWDLYNELYQKAQEYRRQYEFYRKGAAQPPTVVYQTSPEPDVVYVPDTSPRITYYTSPRVYYYTPPRVVHYTPAPTYYYTPGVSLSFGYYGGRSRYYSGLGGFARHHRYSAHRGFGRRPGSRHQGSHFGRHSGSRGHGSGFGGHSGSRGHSSGGRGSGGHAGGGHRSGGGRGH